MSETLYRKYRPKRFADVTEQPHVKAVLQNQLATGTLAHAYLFSGPRGVGKTTIARLLAKAANCENLKGSEPCLACASCLEIERGVTMDLFEIDAASHTGVDHVREMIIDNVRFAPTRLKKKVFIIDEVHMLSTSAFNALLKTLEEPPSYALFILATTELHKVPETIISRCQHFSFHRLSSAAIVQRLTDLGHEEKAKVSKETLEQIARTSGGCLRDAESLLGQVLAVSDPSLVLSPSCTQEAIRYVKEVCGGEPAKAISIVNAAMERGVRMDSFMDEVLALLREMLLLSLGSPVEPHGEPAVERELAMLAESTGAGRTQDLLHTFLSDRTLFELDQFPQMALEVFAAHAQSRTQQKFSEADTPATAATTTHTPPATSTLTPTPPVATIPSPKAQTKIKTTLEEIQSRWSECCECLREHSATLPLVLQNGRVAALLGGELHLHFPFQFHASQINELKNKRLIEGALTKCFAEEICIVAEYVPVNPDELVAELISEFGGATAPV